MPTWVRNLVMVGVFSVWALYIASALLRREEPPLPLWMIPSATYTALTGRIPGFSGKGDKPSDPPGAKP